MPTIAQQIIETIHAAGVRRIYGLVGDSLNGITDSLREKNIDWIPVRHEEVAAFAAGADAEITGNLAVCAGSCGPGNLHLINGLFDCHRNRVPVLAIAAHIPSTETGTGYFQETHPQILFKECSHYVELITSADHVPKIVENAIREAITKRGVSVIVISGDIALSAAHATKPSPDLARKPGAIVPSEADIEALADFLNKGERVTLLCGAGCAGAHDEVIALADKLQSPMVHALRGKEYLEWENPYSVGMTGFIGFASGYHAMMGCDRLLMLGTDFPYRQFYPKEESVAQVDLRGENLGKRCRLDVGVVGDVRETVTRLMAKLKPKTDKKHLTASLDHYKKARAELDELAVSHGKSKKVHPQYLAKVISDAASEDAVFTCDVGEPTVWAARYIQMNGKRRLLGSFLHGSMANAMPQAIGAQVACPKRQVISMSGDGGFAMLMGDILTLRQLKLPVKIVIFNNGLLGFVDLEMKAGGFLPIGTKLDNPDFAAMANAIGIYGVRVEHPEKLQEAVKTAFAHDGPAIIDVVTDPVELIMPPQITAEQVKGFSLWMMKAVLNGQASELIDLTRSVLQR